MRINALRQRFRQFLDRDYGTKLWEKRTVADAEGYLEIVTSPTNDFLWEKVKDYKLINVLEIGSNSGGLLFYIAKKYQNTNFYGVDININSINVAKKYSKENNFTNVNFFTGDIRNIENVFANLDVKKFDLIFTWATLIYVRPKEIGSILKKLTESTRKLILIEQHSKNLRFRYRGKLTSSGRNYLRNYEKILRLQGIEKNQINVVEVPNKVWQPGGGFAKLIEVDLE